MPLAEGLPCTSRWGLCGLWQESPGDKVTVTQAVPGGSVWSATRRLLTG